jgi:hypothetical protein
MDTLIDAIILCSMCFGALALEIVKTTTNLKYLSLTESAYRNEKS